MTKTNNKYEQRGQSVRFWKYFGHTLYLSTSSKSELITQMRSSLEVITKTVPFLYSHRGGEEAEPFEFDNVRLPLLLILLVIRSYARGLKSSSSSSSSNPSNFVPTDGRKGGNIMKSFSLNSLLLVLLLPALGGTGGG
jgi:hypothetical protein